MVTLNLLKWKSEFYCCRHWQISDIFTNVPLPSVVAVLLSADIECFNEMFAEDWSEVLSEVSLSSFQMKTETMDSCSVFSSFILTLDPLVTFRWTDLDLGEFFSYLPGLKRHLGIGYVMVFMFPKKLNHCSWVVMQLDKSATSCL